MTHQQHFDVSLYVSSIAWLPASLALAGSYPAGVLCEIVDRSDGSMARTPLLMAFAD
jgi:hypothetical protein